MPIQTDWDGADCITAVSRYGIFWTWEEFYKELDKVQAMADSVPYPMHWIHHFQRGQLPTGSPIPHLSTMVRWLPDNMRQSLIVYIGAGTFWRIAVTAFLKAYPEMGIDVVYVSTYEDARAAIARKQQQLEDLALLDEEFG